MKCIGCIIPCFKGSQKTIEVINEALKVVDYVVFINDCCPNLKSKIVQEKIKSEKLIIINNEYNQGVGASVKKGIKYLLSTNCEIIVKIDADGQIKPQLIPEIIKPIIDKKADAVKGNRFTNVEHILSMPLIRILGNLCLSFINKLSSGYWELFDPTNGFIAFDAKTLKKIRINKLDDRYFFESSILFECAIANIFFMQLPMKGIYSGEISSLEPLKEVISFSSKHFVNLIKRIIYQYFILDFNAGSIELIGFIITFTTALIYFLLITFKNLQYENVYASPGEANLISILVIIAFQLFISFIFYDATQKPLFRKINH